MKKKLLKLLSWIVAFIVIIVVLNIKVSTRQGINYKVSTLKIPLYLKVLDFFDRHYNYKLLVQRITADAKTDQEKVLRIFEWTCENIKKVPDGYPVIDDHIWHIIIRGYATSDQSADIFCNLCEYAGMPTKWALVYPPASKNPIIISLINLNDGWRVFDTYYGNYFLNKNGEIASIEDIINDFSLIEQAKNKPVINGTEYREYFKGLKNLTERQMWKRAKEQMPLSRLKYEIKKIFSNLR